MLPAPHKNFTPSFVTLLCMSAYSVSQKAKISGGVRLAIDRCETKGSVTTLTNITIDLSVSDRSGLDHRVTVSYSHGRHILLSLAPVCVERKKVNHVGMIRDLLKWYFTMAG